jgi:hypothetical protein
MKETALFPIGREYVCKLVKRGELIVRHVPLNTLPGEDFYATSAKP